MKTRIIHTKFWDDDYTTSLTHKEKLFFLYLFTNQRVNICGIYELPDKNIRADLDLTQREVDAIKTKLQQDGKFAFFKNWVKVFHIERFNSYTGEKNTKAKERELSYAPPEIVGMGINTSIHTSIDTTHNHNHNQNHKEGSVRETTEDKPYKHMAYLLNVPSEDIPVILEDTSATPTDVIKKARELYRYCESKGKTYKNYRSFLMNAVGKDWPSVKNSYPEYVPDRT